MKRDINWYLAHEWGLYDENDPPSEDRPFRLEFCGRTKSQVVYRFKDDAAEPHFAGVTGRGDERTFWAHPAWGMEFEDLADVLRGANWLYGQDHLDLCPERITGRKPPRRLGKHRAVIEGLARDAVGPGDAFELLEGYYLEGLDQYVALVRAKRSGTTLIVGSRIEPAEVGFPDAAAGHRMALAIARHVMGDDR